MKRFLSVVTLIFLSISVSAQGFDLGLGPSLAYNLEDESRTLLLAYLGYGSNKSHIYIGIDLGSDFETKGKYYQGWNQFSGDIVETGITWTFVDGVFGYMTNNMVFAGVLGLCTGREYHNCFDPDQTFNYNGKWHEINGINQETRLNYGFEFKVFIPIEETTSLPLAFRVTNNYFAISLGLGLNVF